ncbi:N-acetylglucosamine-6-phosphate deacetylase [Paenibacillus sp. V4I9]|uniref:N-acetylglucosamine-6-phosphate deacetylase n=1 Tax=Paenibacillus sp. V4I9 TaxID=3042308 RepID=UPI00277FBD27|nr:N-acetylglucosamine-6-phosphate deacetylase [Paenibacillus sp. V4I9]MDQ0886697.1 N-acetylglucosamine-6-phosphate deacetylase [Paenibacillus sp. V4I9]
MSLKILHNVNVVQPDDFVLPATLWIRNGIIEKLESGLSSLPEVEYELMDGEGHLLIPGMIDVHIHGANGFDMMDGSEASNLEGPYLNPKRKGMQNERFLRHPNLTEMKEIFNEADGLIKMVTIAPELPGGMELISFLKENGVIIAVAHSDATYEEAKQAFEAGASHVTHCFNGMRPIHHRDPGLVVAAFEEEHVSLQAIVDGIHLHPAIVRMMHRLKGPDGMVLITDALQAMGLGDGNYVFGGHHVTVSDGVARLEDGTLVSSTVTMNEALRLTVETGISLKDAVQMASTTPARILSLDTLGRISTGLDADLVLLNEQFQVQWTMIKGHII